MITILENMNQKRYRNYMIGYAVNCIIKCVIMNKKYVMKGICMDVITGTSIDIKLVNGKMKPKKRTIKPIL